MCVCAERVCLLTDETRRNGIRKDGDADKQEHKKKLCLQ